MSYEEMIRMTKAMKVYGGGFVKCLADCFLVADMDNINRLLTAFPEYVEKYRKIGNSMTAED